ncbi:tetratricopeptide repeat protein [Burkholderia sp. JKS000303]|uniref:tetratricopeptide repeat protein n=1 Tax=Burkholderia sp. JKS000303 TaxID=1938747 RepID=UPI000C01821B|nr:tetratricopeptide repeat protein [Burkholderia sp. JKS000303]PFH20875.1 TPR repeat protein [Burkholderia sp. JKS000303]
MNIQRKSFFAPFFLAIVCTSANADMQKGLAAYKEKDYATALSEFKREASRGNSEAEVILGNMYISGEGVDVNDQEAAAWYQRAANQGDAEGERRLGTMYYSAAGMSDNYKLFTKAFYWVQKAAIQGDVTAQSMLAAMYQDGLGVGKDDGQALQWYKKASDSGDIYSPNNTGMMYLEGKGVPQSYAEAYKWIVKGAIRGDGYAQRNLGDFYYIGKVVRRDKVIAYAWYNLADSRNSICAPVNKFIVSRELKLSQIAEGQSLAVAWKVGQSLPSHSRTWNQSDIGYISQAAPKDLPESMRLLSCHSPGAM